MKFIEPQLARSWEARRDSRLLHEDGITIEPKLDGHRVAVIRHSGGVALASRYGKPVQDIPWLVTWAQRQLEPGTYVDGELVATGEIDSAHTVHSYRARHPELLAYVAFDLIYYGARELLQSPWSQRRWRLERLSEMAHEWPVDGQLEPGHFYVIGSYSRTGSLMGGCWLPPSSRNELPATWVRQGFEGVMFKDMFAPYKPRSRSAWIKKKETMMAEVIVVSCEGLPSEWRVRPGHVGTDGVLYPDGLHTDPWLAGHVNLEYGYGPLTMFQHADGARVKHVDGVGPCAVAGTLGVTGPKHEMAPLVGKVCKVKCWGAYPSGALRHPSPQTFRDFDGHPVQPPSSTLEDAV